MEVIYKGNSKRLIKNHKYTIQRLYNDGSNRNWLEGKLEIEDLGIFKINTFTDINGNVLPKINYYRKLKEIKKIIEFTDLKKGDLLICKVKDLKSLIYDRIYVIDELYSEHKDYTSTLFGQQSAIVRRIKNDYVSFKGINRKIKYSSWKFEKVKSDIQRQMSLLSILDNQEADIITSIPSRKIDVSLNKEKDLMELVAKSILDKSRHHLSIIEWVYKQIGKNMNLNEQDYEVLLNMKMKDVLNVIE